MKIQTYEVKNLLIVNPETFSLVEEEKPIYKREINSIYEECGFDIRQSLRSQEPSPLPDRKALDDVVFDAIGLSEDERKEVYWATCELVQKRLEKARSV